MLDMIVFLAAGAGVIAYVCRLNSLRIGRHSPIAIALHVSLGATCVFTGSHAWAGDTDGLDVFSLVGALSWIWMSLPTWGKGSVPKQFETKPAPLDEANQ